GLSSLVVGTRRSGGDGSSARTLGRLNGMNNRWGVAALVAAVLLILVTPAGILAQEAAQGWTVELPAEIHARPGESVTTVLSVADATGHPDTYLWEANLPAGWQSLVASTRIVLGPNRADIVF